MFKEINIPIILGFDAPEQAELCFNALETIVPKIKMQDLSQYADESGKYMYMFYTRRDQNYRELMEAYSSNTPMHAVIKFVGGGESDTSESEEGWNEVTDDTPTVGNWQNTGNV